MNRRALLVAGLGFGDEGKGRMTDALVREHQAGLVVRYNGGAQAAHHVQTDDGRVHCFSQFGSGTLAGAATFLSRFVTLDLPALAREAAHLRKLGIPHPERRLWVDRACPVVTPYHRAMNQLRERARGDGRHGSCGRGMGEVARAVAQGHPVVRVGTLDPCCVEETQRRLIREAVALGFDALARRDVSAAAAWAVLVGPSTGWYTEAAAIAASLQFDRPPLAEVTVFEGAQGVLLDEWYGFHPHTTWSTCTFEHARTLCAEWGLDQVTTIGVTRTYATRHGAGPLPSELSPAPREWLRHERNPSGYWQGRLRVGRLDVPLLTYACRVLQPDLLAVTHLDVVTPDWTVVYAYDGNPLQVQPNTRDEAQLTRQAQMAAALLSANGLTWAVRNAAHHLLDMIASATQVPVGYAVWGPIAGAQLTALPPVVPIRLSEAVP